MPFVGPFDGAWRIYAAQSLQAAITAALRKFEKLSQSASLNWSPFARLAVAGPLIRFLFHKAFPVSTLCKQARENDAV